MINQLFYCPYTPPIGGVEYCDFWTGNSKLNKSMVLTIVTLILIPVTTGVVALPWVTDQLTEEYMFCHYLT